MQRLKTKPCDNLLFTSPDERARINNLLTSHLEEVVVDLKSWFPRSNIYLSGSVARREPSLVLSESVTGLHSDIDWILVSGWHSKEDLNVAERLLNRCYSPFHDTLYGFQAYQVPRLRSASARDFFLGMREPLVESFPLEPPPCST